jgi:hypothetical protein
VEHFIFSLSPASSPTSRQRCFTFVFYGLHQGISRAVGKAFASDFEPAHLRASAVGWYSATVGLLQLVASVVAGLL